MLNIKKNKNTTQDLEGFRHVQRLAYESVIEIGKLIQVGWTEKQAADMIGTYLKDKGVKAFFHEPYAWFGDRTRFDGINRLHYSDFNPTHRRLQENDVAILDVAPIVDGYIGDIGYTISLKKNTQLEKAMTFLRQLRKEIPALVDQNFGNGGKFWTLIDGKIKKGGYDNIHQIYPFHVIGHRLKRVPLSNFALKTPFRFSMHSFYQIFSSGFTSELWNAKHKGTLEGLWAIEPHIGWSGAGAKFEEILVVTEKESYWLDDEVPHYCEGKSQS